MSETVRSVAWQIFALIQGEELVALVAKNPDKSSVVDITDDLAHLLNHRRTSTPPQKPKMSDMCPDPIVAGWTMQQCFDAKKCSCARGAAMGYQPTTQPTSGG